MSYLQFHLYLIGPAVLLGGLGWFGLEWGWGTSSRRDVLLEVTALGLVSVIAFVYTLPWDHQLISWQVWTYDVDRVAATVWDVPVEECAFFVLQPLLAGSWYAVARRLFEDGNAESVSAEPGSPSSPTNWVTVFGSTSGAVAGGTLAILGLGLTAVDRSLYVGMILLWSGPVLALQWGLAGHLFWWRRRSIVATLCAASLFLWIADRIALRAGIWEISSRYTVGVSPFGLPLEEAIFFFVTNVLVVQGLVMLTENGAP